LINAFLKIRSSVENREIEKLNVPDRHVRSSVLTVWGLRVQPPSRKLKRRFNMLRTTLSGVIAFGTILLASLGASDPCCTGRKPSVEPKHVESAFERFKGLVGDWDIASPKFEAHKGKIQARYRLTAGGSALVETVFPGEAMEMVTVYHRDGDQLMLTHFCHVGNQPRMRTRNVDDNGELVFDFAGGSNLDPATDTHMHSMRIRFVDADHVQTEWELYQDGKAAEKYKFDLVRRK
jgi:hypothetical protein